MSILPSRFAHARILVVDDSDFQRQLILVALKKAGFSNIILADDGVDAVQKTYDFHPDLVLLDLKMPTLDGFGYCETVRGDPDLPRMPIVVQTSLDDRQSRLHALSCGADDYLNKPVDMVELSLRIRIHVERYLMLRDMEQMCGYLKMERDAVQTLRSDMQGANLSPSDKENLDNHFEVLTQLALISAG